MDIGVDLIRGDDSESEVFAQAQSKDLSLIFRYFLNPKLPQSLSSRVVNCYCNLSLKDASETFSERAAMPEALVWDQCAMHPSISAPDVTIEIYEDAERKDQWRISHESLYKQYVESLLPVSSLFQRRRLGPSTRAVSQTHPSNRLGKSSMAIASNMVEAMVMAPINLVTNALPGPRPINPR